MDQILKLEKIVVLPVKISNVTYNVRLYILPVKHLNMIIVSRSEKHYRRKRIIPVLTIGKQSERFGQRLAIPLPGEKKLIGDC